MAEAYRWGDAPPPGVMYRRERAGQRMHSLLRNRALAERVISGGVAMLESEGSGSGNPVRPEVWRDEPLEVPKS